MELYTDYNTRTMESGNHFKNVASLKSLRSKRCMNKNITRLASVVWIGIALGCLPLVGQNVKVMPLSELPVSKQGYELRAAVATDSCITYSMTGEYVYKEIKLQDGSSNAYNWLNNTWTEEPQPQYRLWMPDGGTADGDKSPSIMEQDGIVYLVIDLMRGFGSWRFTVDGRAAEYTTTKDSNGNIISADIEGGLLTVQYDAALNQPTSIDLKHPNGTPLSLYTYEYQEGINYPKCTFFQHTEWNVAKEKWVAGSWGKHIRKYTKDGSKPLQLSLNEEYTANANGDWVGENKYGNFLYDATGKMATFYHYAWHNNNWMATPFLYTIFYPNSLTPNFSFGNNSPVYGTNKGSFDLGTIVLPDSVSKASFTIKFPAGFALDKDSTRLTTGWNGYELTITPQDSNQWLVTIQPKALRSALRAETNPTLVHVAYTVDSKVKRGTYDMAVHSIQVETPGGNTILEPAITVPVQLNRWGTGNEEAPSQEPTLYLAGHTLYIQSIRAEHITIYSINGLKLYESEVPAGTATIDVARFPKSVLIIRGSSGWTRKAILSNS